MNNDELETIEKKETNIKWAARIAYIIITLAIVGVGLVAFWLTADEKPLVIKNQPTPVKTATVHKDGYAIVNYDYCKNTTANGELRMSFVSDKSEIFLPVVTEKTDKGCKTIDAPIIIPPQVTPGMYHLKFRVTYQVNPLKTVIVIWESESFNVVE